MNDSAETAQGFPDDKSVKVLVFSTLFRGFPILPGNAV
ncbi:hypothetical protein X971_0722 [Agrobacterium tumefaciens LBA4213 (Ach5)]|nr:hypothetical protein X971_0722 [Agrobacterium tumefaciens LBA4213 (Ach5)]